jgi:hypothetical protein
MWPFKKKRSDAEKMCDDFVEKCEEVIDRTESFVNDIAANKDSFENLGRGIGSAANSVKELTASIAGYLGKLKAGFDEKRLGVPFTFAECIKYLASHAKDSPKIAGGAILREPYTKGKTDGTCWEITVFFLDKENNPVCDGNDVPLGFKTIRRNLDEELRSAFKNNNLIIVN